MTFYSSDDEQDPASWLSNIHGTFDGDGPATNGELRSRRRLTCAASVLSVETCPIGQVSTDSSLGDVP
ncbi:MAG: hypothetical protein WKF58_08320 [Ilumatobacteraceae bacterium]